MMLFTFGPRAVQRLAPGWIVLSILSLSSTFALAQEAPKPDAKPAPEKARTVLTDPPFDGKFDKLPFDGALKRESATITKTLAEGEVEKGKEGPFDTYFQKYSLGRWTQPENLASLPVYRKELRSQLTTTFNKGSNKAHTRLNSLLLDQLDKIAKGNFAPAVRVNAMLMLGDLNSQESAKPGAAPIPLPAALVPITRAISDDKQLESVKVAALEGLRRHVDTPPGVAEGEARRAMVASLVKLVAATPSPDRLPIGHDWMRGSASEVLGAIGEAGEKGEIALALGQLAGSSKATLGARRAAARALGRLDYAKAAGLDTAPLSIALGQLAVDACQQTKRDLGADELAPADLNRQLRGMVNAVRIGLKGADDKHKGVAGVAKDGEQQKLAASAVENVNNLAAALDARDVDKEKIGAAIEAAVTALTPLVEKTK